MPKAKYSKFSFKSVACCDLLILLVIWFRILFPTFFFVAK